MSATGPAERRDHPFGVATRDRDIERRTFRRVGLICLVAFPFVAALNALTLLTDARRTMTEIAVAEPWLLEATSVAATFLLIPGVAMLERRYPIASDSTLRNQAVLLAATLPFSLAHVGIMVGLRVVLVPAVAHEPYVFFTDPIVDLFYEYRKDLFIYAVIIGLLTLSRQLELSRQESADARVEARETGQLTLKSGGRIIHMRARDFIWAQAGGNYVDVMAAGQTYLPRITLSELEQQLRNAAVDVVRVHRSRIVNRESIREVRPTPSGDMEIRLSDDTVVRGSRRYRADVDNRSTRAEGSSP